MGASGWAYYVPYQSDINKALQELRQEVFEKKQYYNPMEVLLSMPEELRGRYFDEDELDIFDSIPTEPTTVEELLEINGEHVTHSIIDITEVSSQSHFGTVSSLSQQELEILFGTNRPTKNMIEQQKNKLMNLREGWQGVYVIVYEDEKPSEIYFTGFSGD